MRNLIVFVICFCLPLFSFATEPTQSVVKIYATLNRYDYRSPWNAPEQTDCVSSGFVIEGNKILTVAHGVENQVFLEVRLDNDAYRYPATVVFIDRECDLAILEVLEEEFYEKVQPLSFGNIPCSGDLIRVYGFPVGGEQLCLTQGVVSRTEVINYFLSGSWLLASQIDAPVNPGNSGGPVLLENEVVGVAFQKNFYSENMGYMIPTPVIEHFLGDFKEGKPSRFPSMNISFQTLESPHLRNYYQMPKNQTGILVTSVFPGSSAAGIIQSGDIILSVDGDNIGNDGKVHIDHCRVLASHLINMRKHGEEVKIEILRDGDIHTLPVRLEDSYNSSLLIPFIMMSEKPKYYIYGGLVFQPLTQNYLYSFGNDWMYSVPKTFISCLHSSKKKDKDHQIVVLSRILRDRTNIGYNDFSNAIVWSVNGKNIHNFKELISILETQQEGFVEIITSDGKKIVLDATDFEEKNEKILQNYRIRI